MKQLKLREGDLYISDDLYKTYSETWKKDQEEAESNTKVLFSLFLDRILKKRLLRDYVDAYGKSNNLERCALLAARCIEEDRGSFRDGSRRRSMQSWVESEDGKYSALILPSYSSAKMPKTRKSILVLPDIDLIDSNGADLNETFLYKLVVPGREKVDHCNIENELEKLLKSNGRE